MKWIRGNHVEDCWNLQTTKVGLCDLTLRELLGIKISAWPREPCQSVCRTGESPDLFLKKNHLTLPVPQEYVLDKPRPHVDYKDFIYSGCCRRERAQLCSGGKGTLCTGWLLGGLVTEAGVGSSQSQTHPSTSPGQASSLKNITWVWVAFWSICPETSDVFRPDGPSLISSCLFKEQ